MTVKVAHIVPPRWEGLFAKGEYSMALAHWVLLNDNYAKALRKVSGRYIILDNGVFEGEQLPSQKLREACEKIRADEVVLPDTRGNPKDTLEKSAKYLQGTPANRVMFVPQATSLEGWFRCLDAWLNAWVSKNWSEVFTLTIGVSAPRTSLEDMTPKRAIRTVILQNVAEYGYPLHLLGVSDPKAFAYSELPEAKLAGVRGVDTSLAFALGANDILLTPSAKKIHLGDPDKYESLNTGQKRLTLLNQRILSEWCSAGKGDDRIATHWIRQTAKKWLKYYAEGFASIKEVMKACCMPRGKYALLQQRRREVYVRRIFLGDNLEEGEKEVRL